MIEFDNEDPFGYEVLWKPTFPIKEPLHGSGSDERENFGRVLKHLFVVYRTYGDLSIIILDHFARKCYPYLQWSSGNMPQSIFLILIGKSHNFYNLIRKGPHEYKYTKILLTHYRSAVVPTWMYP